MTVDTTVSTITETDILRKKNGVESRLFSYLHPIPGHKVEMLKKEGDSNIYLHCLTDGKTSGPLKPLRTYNT